jgi:glutamyl-tRNA synthetase
MPTMASAPRAAGADGRFAPSPSADLHLGNLRTALLAWLYARSANAQFSVRVDDLDRGRSRPEIAARQLADLAAIGLDWDGPVVWQSERAPAYDAALDVLRDAGLLYRCWCTRAEIREAVRAPHGELAADAYPGTCAALSAAQVAQRERSGRPPALRVRAAGAQVTFADRLAGEQRAALDDFVVRRNDGSHAYNLAVVVDDAALRVGEVVRGADLLGTTARQLWLYGRLGEPAPRYAHVPLMLGADGERLAKRHGAVTLADRLALGESVEQVCGALAASVGLALDGEAATPGALLAGFEPDCVLQAQ